MEEERNYNDQMLEYRKSLFVQKSKSDDDFEKYITFISSGALGLTLTFIENISPLKESIIVWVVILGWLALTTTLFLNLLSHYLSSKYNEKTIQDIDSEIKEEKFKENLEKRNKIISFLNLTSIILLGIGILLILLFISINAYN